MRVHRGKAVLAGIAALALALTACSSSGGGNSSGVDPKSGTKGTGAFADCATNPTTCNSGDTQPGGSVTYTLEKTFAGWNINYTNSNVFEIAEALDGVVPGAFLNGSDLQPFLNSDLMVSAEQTVTDPQTLVYKIKPTAVWSDGKPIDASDFDYQYKTSNGTDCPDCGPSSTAGYDQIASITPSDNDKTITVVMKKPFADWQSMFGTLYPAHIAAEHGDLTTPTGLNDSFQWFDKNVPTWSGGPLIIDSYRKDTEVVEKPNPKWFGATKSSLDTVKFHIITDQTAEPTALQNKDVDVLYPQPNADLVSQVDGIQGVQSYVGKGLVWEHFNLNEKNEFLSDKPLRQAIFTAINRKDIIARTYAEFVPNMAPIGNHMYVPGQPGYQDNVTDTGQGSGDLDAAKKLLTDAGYTGVGDNLMTKDGKHVAFRCTYSEGNTYRQTECTIVQNTLKSLGIDVTLKTSADLSELGTGDFDMIVFAWVGTPFVVAGALQLYTPNGGAHTAYTYNDNPAATKLIVDATSGTDPATVQKQLNDADKLLEDDAFELPLYQKPTFLAAYNNIVNIRDNATSSGPPVNVQDWGVKAS
ncbi:MAG: glutathione transport system substrate-binding protein [Pseudonocardiales bacterium]|nr:glutathione transport system substrate-binding protein [Pseudonocardiales bacterium]